jgi:hypothetical protein
MAAIAPQGLLEALSAVADPRKSRGVRHRFISILAFECGHLIWPH